MLMDKALMPIPLFLLKDSIILKKYTGKDQREKPLYTDIPLSKVYLRFTEGKLITTNGLIPDDTLKIFYDNTNSAPSGQKFSDKDKFYLNNAHDYGFDTAIREFSVTNVKPSPFNHHIEIGAK